MRFHWNWAAAVVWCAAVLGGSPLHADTPVYTVSDADSFASSNSELADLLSQPPGNESEYGYDDSGDACGCDSGCDACGASCCDEPWRLVPPLPGCFTVTGWIAVGGTANADDPASRFNGPVTFNDREDFQLNQGYLVVERALDNGGCGWGWGGRIDALYGSDYVFTQSAGWETRQDGSPRWNSHRFHGVALPQVYVDVAYNNLALRVGHFYTIIGNEVVAAPDNFFYSHAYTMQYGEPFTHHGGLLTWTPSDQLTVWGGWVNGWDRLDGVSNRGAFLGGASWTSCDETISLAATAISGREADALGGFSNRTMYSLVASFALNERLEYVIQHDNGWQENGVNVPVAADAEWYGINQYLFYTINDCWKAGARLEWFRDDDGTRVAGPRPTNPNAGPFTGDFYQVSLGLNWTPRTNLTVRPEIRYDHFSGAGLPYDDGTQDDQLTGGLDVILIF